MSTEPPQFSEEELRQIEAEMERVTVDDVLLQTIVTLLNLAARKAGLAAPPGEGEPKRDLEQVRIAIEGVRALLPLVEPRHGDKLGQVKQMLSQLQIAYAQLAQGAGGSPPPAESTEPAPAADQKEEGAGPAQQSGELAGIVVGNQLRTARSVHADHARETAPETGLHLVRHRHAGVASSRPVGEDP